MLAEENSLHQGTAQMEWHLDESSCGMKPAVSQKHWQGDDQCTMHIITPPEVLHGSKDQKTQTSLYLCFCLSVLYLIRLNEQLLLIS